MSKQGREWMKTFYAGNSGVEKKKLKTDPKKVELRRKIERRLDERKQLAEWGL